MKQVLKKVLGLLLVLAIVAVLAVLFTLPSRHPCFYPSVREGITWAEAVKLAEEQDGYFIVAKNTAFTGTYFTMAYGDDKGIDLELSGNTPMKDLSWVFFYARDNYFLVRGEEKNTENKGKEVYDPDTGLYLISDYTIDVDEWEIITPIHRSYTYERHGRWVYPLWCLDAYDVEHGDYIEEPDN